MFVLFPGASSLKGQTKLIDRIRKPRRQLCVCNKAEVPGDGKAGEALPSVPKPAAVTNDRTTKQDVEDQVPNLGKSYLADRIGASTTGATTAASKLPSMFDSMTKRKEAARREALTIVVLGASGDLARKKTLPALFSLFYHDLLPNEFQVVGYARTSLTSEAFRNAIKASLTCRVIEGPECARKMEVFLSRCFYVSGTYHDSAAFRELDQFVTNEFERERWNWGVPTNRLYYLAIPPNVFAEACRSIAHSYTKPPHPSKGWMRVVLEKPFGRDSSSFTKLHRELLEYITEEQTFRIDHYLGKELVQNVLALRFANYFLEPLWNNQHIQSIQVTFKENFGVEGRAGYFDHYGIIRDIMQNHLLQMVALFTMEQPVSLHAEDIRDEKVKVLRSLEPLRASDFVIGQYIGYSDEDGVRLNSKTPTFAACRMNIRNRRWDGVPILIKAGKHLDERLAEVRITFHSVPGCIFSLANTLPTNELVVRVQPDEAIYLRIISKSPGLTSRLEEARLTLFYRTAWEEAHDIPDAYERLILDVIYGDKSLFIRSDELEVAWDKFTPALHELELSDEYRPVPYVPGSRGPAEADYLAARYGCMWASDLDIGGKRLRSTAEP
jgi:glucose-6-phosphate 1-dehydrogenase